MNNYYILLEPGFVNSDIQKKTDKRQFLASVLSAVSGIAAKSTVEGALPLLYVALSPELDNNHALRGQMFTEVF